MRKMIKKRVMLIEENQKQLEKIEALFFRDSIYKIVTTASNLNDAYSAVDLIDLDYIFINESNASFDIEKFKKDVLRTRPRCKFESTYRILQVKYQIPFTSFDAFYEHVCKELDCLEYSTLDPNINLAELGISYEKNFIVYRKYIQKVSDVLTKMGVPTNVCGYKYLREAIMVGIENPMSIISLTKDLYPNVAKKFSTTVNSVERGIRHAITMAWENRNFVNLNDVLNFNIDDLFYEKPSNGRFISLIVDRMRLEIEEVVN